MRPTDLRARLHELKISSRELADEIQVTPRAVRFGLAGDRTIPQERVEQALTRISARREGYRSGRCDAAAAAQKAILEY